MKISKSSWHWRLLKTLDMLPDGWGYWGEVQFCPYVRRLLVSMFLMIPYVTLLAAGTLFLLFGPFTTYGDGDTQLSIVSFITWSVLGSFVFSIYHMEHEMGDGYAKDIVLFTIKAKAKGPKEPNIFAEYMHALHTKMCPIVKLED